MHKGLTRNEILDKLAGKLKPGSFDLYCARANILKIDERSSKSRSHILEYIYPLDSVEKLEKILGV